MPTKTRFVVQRLMYDVSCAYICGGPVIKKLNMQFIKYSYKNYMEREIPTNVKFRPDQISMYAVNDVAVKTTMST